MMEQNPRAGKFKLYIHDKTSVEYMGVQVDIETDGKIRLSQKSIEDGEEVEDVIETSAGLFTRVIALLRATRRVKWVDKEVK